MSLDVLNGCEMKEEVDVECKGGGVCGPRPELVYSYAKLLELKCHPLAQIWPPYLDQTYKNMRGYWDPDRWHLEQKRSETPAGEKGKETEKGKEKEKARMLDKDRQAITLTEGGKGVDDSIILSPQRGSFQLGCHAVKDELNLRPDQPSRRVGSGRILPLRPEKEEFPPNRGSRTRNERENPREWDRDYSKYGFRREEEDRRNWDDRRAESYHDERGDRGGGGGGPHDRRGGRGRGGSTTSAGGGGQRRPTRRSENEPEWLNESVSLADIIELKGFDDAGSSGKGRNSRPNSRQSNKSQDRAGGNQSDSGQSKPSNSGKIGQSTPALSVVGAPLSNGGGHPKQQPFRDSSLLDSVEISAQDVQRRQQQQQQDGFNFDQIMEAMNLNSLLGGLGSPDDEMVCGSGSLGGGLSDSGRGSMAAMTGSGVNGTSGSSAPAQQSRFSQFFKKPQAVPRSRKSSIQDEFAIAAAAAATTTTGTGVNGGAGTNILREINGEPLIKIPSPEESNKYFTPISPAAKTGQGSNVLLDMLQKGHQDQLSTTETKDVQKLEDKIKKTLGLEKQQQQQQQRQQAVGAQHQLPPPPQLPVQQQHHQQPAAGGITQQQPKQNNDLSAFMKLVAQVKGQPAAGERPSGPGHQQVAGGGFVPGLVRPTPIPQMTAGLPPAPSMPANILTEQEILDGRAMAVQQQQRINIQTGLPPQLLQFLEHLPLNPEVIKRPEAEHLLNCLNNGSLPIGSVLHQLSNPNMQPRQRELILSVLKLKSVAAHQLHHHQQQQHHPNPHHSYPPPLQASMAGLMAAAAAAGNPHLVNRASPLLATAEQQQQQHLLSQPPPMPSAASHSRVSPLMFGPTAAAAGGSVGGGSVANSHLAVSPGPQSQRVPSPQEMTVLTQHILQNALIKKKLEEQKENYRKKHEGKSEDKENIRSVKSSSENGNSSSPLAFTPTSVMRKNAAERKDSDPKPNIPEQKAKSVDRPASLELTTGRTTRNSIGRAQAVPSHAGLAGPSAAPMPGLVGPGGTIPGNMNPLLFLTNPGMNPAMLGAAGGMSGFGPPNAPPTANLNALIGAGAGGVGGSSGSGRFPHSHHPGMHHASGGNGMRMGPPSPVVPSAHQAMSGSAAAVTSAGNGSNCTLSRFFSNDVLAAAAQGARTMAMPPLPTGQAITLEEIERQAASAATVKI